MVIMWNKMVISLDILNLFPTPREVPIPLDLMCQSFKVSLGKISTEPLIYCSLPRLLIIREESFKTLARGNHINIKLNPLAVQP